MSTVLFLTVIEIVSGCRLREQGFGDCDRWPIISALN